MHTPEPRTTNHSFPQRVACLQPSATSILNALGLLDRVVACTKYCLDIVPEARDRVIVEDSWTANAEQMDAIDADLVLASVPYQAQSVIEILKVGVPVLLLAPHSLADVYKDIAMIAGVMGVPERAENVINEMRGAIFEVQTRTQNLPRVHVFCEEWGKPIIASQPWVAELIEAAGGIPIGDPGKVIDSEAIRSAEPDVLIASWCGAGNRVPLEKIARDRRWLATPAALNARFYCINDELLNTPGPSLVGGLRAIAHAIHPELFPAVPGIRPIKLPIVI